MQAEVKASWRAAMPELYAATIRLLLLDPKRLQGWRGSWPAKPHQAPTDSPPILPGGFSLFRAGCAITALCQVIGKAAQLNRIKLIASGEEHQRKLPFRALLL